jgi:cytochrome c-type biogenesis protein CcmE
MKHKFAKIAVTAVVLGSAFGGLLWYSIQQDMQYYKRVAEVMVSPSQWQGKALKLHGFVVPGSIFRARNTLDWKFKVQHNGSVVEAAYHGVVPDTFKDDSEVVLDGRLTPHGFQVAPDGVMAKCPSKYEPKPEFKDVTSSN